ncbi:flavohemoglobin expression-modulating QEGLA motif protein [Robiginitomaculum antarcticum]|uniref:flavohemoglobin expression-modulating QEGLA motif protein n=1 Tax=Robiginitomaculum antarcticum TaxID=437507 RepID=UPI0003819498|nr:flavohemoglobin expression-modulating QEGLA motif protein [Robiginitomaculum antarcticum]
MSKSFHNEQDIAAHLYEAAKDLRVLKSVAWPGEVREAFLAANGTKMPVVTYPDVDTAPARQHLQDAGVMLDGDAPVMEWLRRIHGVLKTQAEMLDARETRAFYTHSSTLFGTPQMLMLDGKTQVIELARHIDETLRDLEFENLVLEGADDALTARQFAAELEPKVAKYFGEDAPNIELSKSLSAKATASSRRIRVRDDAQFTQMDVRQLLQHEALIHTATALNGKTQNHFPILGSSHMGTTQIQEGLAVFAEMIAGTMDPKRFRRLADRVIAIDMAAEGADFIEVYRFFIGQTGDREESFENTRRVFRGGVLTGGAPFTKDLVYLNGLLRVHNFLRSVVSLNRADLIRVLFVGKMDLEDVPAIAELIDNKLIETPRYMPRWAKDLRFVVSYLTYSSFLNRIKLPGFQGYYKDRLAAVPSVWHFDKPG